MEGEKGQDKLWQRDVCAGCKQKKILVAQDPDTNDYFCSQCWDPNTGTDNLKD